MTVVNIRPITELRVNMRVVDTWWPLRYGVVVKVLKTRVKVKWGDGTLWTYDKAHEVRYLRAA